MPVDDSITTSTHIFAFQNPTISTSDGFTSIEIEGCEQLIEPGMPIIPIKIATYKLPFGSRDIEVCPISAAWEPMNISRPFKTATQPMPMLTARMQEFYGKSYHRQIKTYEQNRDINYPFPAEIVRFTTGAGIDPLTLERCVFATIHLFPVRILSENPPEIVFLRNCEVHLTYTPGNGFPKPTAPEADQREILIICSGDMVSQYNVLAGHKNANGLRTNIVTVSQIESSAFFPATGRDTQEKMKNFIKKSD